MKSGFLQTGADRFHCLDMCRNHVFSCIDLRRPFADKGGTALLHRDANGGKTNFFQDMLQLN